MHVLDQDLWTAEYFGENNIASHLFVILSKPEQDGRELWIRCGDASANLFLQKNTTSE